MKILYVGQMRSGGTCAMRFRALQDLGHDAAAVDLSPPHLAKISRSLPYRAVFRLLGPRDLSGANAEIVKHFKKATKPFDVLWLDKALTITAKTLRTVKILQPGCRIVGYSPDDMYAVHNHSEQFLQHLPLYDLFATTKTYGVSELQSLGCPNVVFSGNAFDPHTHRPIELSREEREKYEADVSFIGTFEQDRAEQMQFLAENGIAVRIWGGGWQRWRRPHRLLKIEGRELISDEYAKAICASKINLGFLRKLNRDLQTQRSIEIPACEGFMLAERTEEHLALFRQGEEAEFFSSREELLQKAMYYLDNPPERQRIALAGYQRCLRNGYSYRDRMGQILDLILESRIQVR